MSKEMNNKVKCGLIQMSLKGDTSMSTDEIRDKMIEAHLPMIDEAAEQGVQLLCFQEVFTQPYFCPSQDKKWYDSAEKIPEPASFIAAVVAPLLSALRLHGGCVEAI
ncbi:hypothetical protein M8006_11930 [Halomonas sp. ATCHA]|uniref:CN hydrolase domain-containing protein n=1 Tax=Halomonas llamarensis TaxID=2945104 RepID=A0ABT0SSG0_9GAMM|nr:nitrilase-related carbon-nitrogen hydrolase [Halomonas llamarensis]MCL7930676.1 hypothetical protein [Halomonas llamarensis]